MAKVYDPIMCMMVDKPDKAQDELLFYQLKFGSGKTEGAKLDESEIRSYAEALLEKYDEKRVTVSRQGKIIATYMRNKDAKAKDRLVKVPDNKLKEFEANLRSAGFKVVSKSDRGMTTHYQVEVSSSKKFSTDAELREWAKKIDAVCDKMDSVAPTTWNIGLTTDGKITAGLDVREMYVKDSASVLDEAIKTADGMFSKAFGEYSKGAKFKKDKFLKELAGIEDAKEFASKMQTFDNELRKNLERLDEAYNVAGQDYYSACNEIRSIMDAFSKEAFGLYKKLAVK